MHLGFVETALVSNDLEIWLIDELGEEVATLIDDEQKASGYHVAIWNGRNHHSEPAASGIYLYGYALGTWP